MCLLKLKVKFIDIIQILKFLYSIELERRVFDDEAQSVSLLSKGKEKGKGGEENLFKRDGIKGNRLPQKWDRLGFVDLTFCQKHVPSYVKNLNKMYTILCNGNIPPNYNQFSALLRNYVQHLIIDNFPQIIKLAHRG